MKIRTPSELGHLIRERRRELGLDQGALAARVGVSRLWLNEFERGKPRAAIGLVLRTLAALGLDVDVVQAKSLADDIDAVVDAARRRR